MEGKRRSPVTDLAYTFVTEVLGEPWDYRSPLCRRALGEAKRLLSPSKDPVTGEEAPPLSASRLRRALALMVQYGQKPRTLYAVLHARAPDGRSWYEYVDTPPPAPPIYDLIAVREWALEHREVLEERGVDVEALLQTLLQREEEEVP